MKNSKIVFAVLLSAAVGCRTYRPAPIDWEVERSVWMERGKLSFASLDDVAKLALVGNADLNLLRLKRASSDRVAKAAGWWEDPELGFDLLRIVNPSEDPLVGGASFAMTIPLSGVKGLERRAAEAYSEADAADVVVAELETRTAARSAAVRLLAARESVRLLTDFESDPRVVNALATAERLSEAGEVSRTDAVSARLRRHQRLHRLRDAETTVMDLEQSLRRILGVAPGVELWFGFPADAAEVPRKRTPGDCLDHPRVQAAVARLKGGEAALEAEIRRQYPEIRLGPSYAREEGTDRFGVTAGLTLPLWNRNRKGIAEAEGVRDEARMTAVKVWRETVLEADVARRMLERLENHPPETPPDRRAADELSDAGEIGALEYLVMREEALDAELAERDWHRDVRLAEENLRQYETEEK